MLTAFQHQHLDVGQALAQLQGQCQARQAAAHDDDVVGGDRGWQSGAHADGAVKVTVWSSANPVPAGKAQAQYKPPLIEITWPVM